MLPMPFEWQSGKKPVLYLLEQPVHIMDFVFLALPLIAQGLDIAQRSEPSKQVGVRGAPVWPSTSKLDAVQLKVPGSSKLVFEQFFQLFHPRRVSKLLRNWNILCTPTINSQQLHPYIFRVYEEQQHQNVTYVPQDQCPACVDYSSSWRFLHVVKTQVQPSNNRY